MEPHCFVFVHVYKCNSWRKLKPGIFGDRWKPMKIPIWCQSWNWLLMSSGRLCQLCCWWPQFYRVPQRCQWWYAKNQLMTLMTTNLINFTDNTEQSGNSWAKAVLPTHLFPFFWFFHQFLQLFKGWQHWISRPPSGKHWSSSGKHRSPLVKHRWYRIPLVASSNHQLLLATFLPLGQILCQSISNNWILRFWDTDCNGIIG